MTFEPTFDDLESKSASLPDVSGSVSDADTDAEPEEVERDLAGDSDLDGDAAATDDNVDDTEEGELGAALSGDVEANDLPPLGA